MPVFVGAGAPQALHGCYISGDARIEFIAAPTLTHSIAVDLAYTHLGSIKDAKRNAIAEIPVLKGEARSAQKQLSKAARRLAFRRSAFGCLFSLYAFHACFC